MGIIILSNNITLQTLNAQQNGVVDGKIAKRHREIEIHLQ